MIISDEIKAHQIKACGPEGISPDVFKFLPVNWLFIVTTVFNYVLTSANYPMSWTSRAKFMTILKKGNRQEPRNYRGISVINNITKLHDMVLCARLKRWFLPYKE